MAESTDRVVTKEDKLAEAKELFGRGSRNYCMKQYMDAADDLSSCCAIYSELYGTTAEECGLPYLLYAKSLIAIGKDENNLIVPGEEEEPDDEDDEEEEDGGEPNSTEKAENGCEEKPVEVEKEQSEEEKSSKSSENNVSQKEGDKAESTSKPDEPQPGPSSSNGAEQEQKEDIDECENENAGSNLEVAWEILELAVKIFETQGDKSFDNLADCYSELASISFENSNFEIAINDYTKALSVYDKNEKSDSRMTAEIHYKLGLCHMMLNDFENSIKSLKAACSELDKVIEKEKAKEQTDETKATIEDLEEMKQEIGEKILEVEESNKTSIEEVKRELSKIIVKDVASNGPEEAGPSTAAATNGASSSSKTTEKATDITHLIKRKKPDTITNDSEGSPAKKAAVDADKTDV